ncbi:MAG TPA: phosphotransferase family protein [Caulobacteraceae bacterium]|nr:phosphotransferase family protein [Caulobacteraceae bacterium]
MADSLDRTASDRLGFEIGALDAWMTAQVDGYAGPLEVRRFQGGQSNPTFHLLTPGRQYVLRRKPPGKLLASAHAVDREFRVISALHPAGFPVPRPYALCEDEAVIGTMFYVMELVDGRILRDPLLPTCSPADRRAIWLDMVRVLADLHSRDHRALGLETFGRGENYLARQIDRWTRQYRASETERHETIERLIGWLPRTAPANSRTCLVHGDFKIDNVVIDPVLPEVKAVLDWELSTIGDPLGDFTYLMMNWVSGPIADLPDLAAHGVPTLDECVAEYCRLTGRDGLPDLNWCFAYNFFRLACILQGIVGRARDGTANSPEAASMALRVPVLADAAWRFAVKAGA